MPRPPSRRRDLSAGFWIVMGVLGALAIVAFGAAILTALGPAGGI